MLATLEADRVRVAELQAQIMQLEQAVSQLRIEQSRVQQRLDSYRYPVLTLPNELICEIFMHVLPPYPDFPHLIGPLSPLPLTQICRRWREIALGTGELWSALSSFDDIREDLELHIFELWLKRSRCCALSVRLGTTETWASDELIAAIIPHRARWEYMKIDLDGDKHRIFDGPMPLLRRLELLVRIGRLANGPLANFALHDAPLLRTLVLKSSDTLQITFPWAQITSLTLPALHPHGCIPILAETRNLVHCELYVLNFHESDTDPRRDINLPCLRALTLVHSGGAPARGFHAMFVVPALRSLKMPENFLAPNRLESLTAFISKSGCKLEELHFTGKRLLPKKSYRQAFPSLRKLAFDRAMIDDGEDSMDSDS
ncbi:hypothetical protein DFH06DRAFT_1480328 [Mycena polygramma]|nr:hypothetical protein DFH06DRAFT_1480328 [Mycena polygramma]